MAAAVTNSKRRGMPHIPSDLVADILSRLVVKPLLRFKCVSKPWLALIDSPDFIKLHLNHSVRNRTLIFRDYNHIHSLDLYSLHNRIQLNNSPKYDDFITILGSCNGVICLRFSDEDIVLWNPSTQKQHKLPLIPFPDPKHSRFCSYILYGFGYDHLNDDYKVITIIQYFDSFCHYLFESRSNVYTLKSNSWQRVSDFPHDLRYKSACGILVNGALHWVVWVVSTTTQSDKGNFIAAFDLGTEKHRLVPEPDYSDTDFQVIVGVLGGCLSVVSGLHLHYVDIWVMKDYGVKESWTKLISIAQQIHNSSFYFISPIAYSKSGEQVLLLFDHTWFVWYDLESKKFETVKVSGLGNFYNSNVFVESLIKLPDGGGRTNGKNLQSVEKRKNDKNKEQANP